MSASNEFSHVIREWAQVFMNHSMGDFKRFMEDTGLSFSHVNILMRLYHGGMSGISGIGERLGITNAAASQTVDRLVNMGLITRTEDPQDRRAKQIVLTSKGRELIETGIDARSRWIETLTDSLSTSDVEKITSSLIILTNAARRLEETSKQDCS